VVRAEQPMSETYRLKVQTEVAPQFVPKPIQRDERAIRRRLEQAEAKQAKVDADRRAWEQAQEAEKAKAKPRHEVRQLLIPGYDDD
jgi:hypothetical protein